MSIFNLFKLPIAGNALSALGSLFGGIINKSSTDSTNAMNYSLFNLANQWNLNMWKMQNDYNTPSAQRDRMLDAGLNPINYGLDGTANGGSIATAQPLPMQSNQMGEFIANALDMEKAARTNKTNAETKLTNSQQMTEEQIRKGKVDILGVEIELAQSQKSLNEKQVQKVATEIDQINQNIAESVRRMDVELGKLSIEQQNQWLKEQMFAWQKQVDKQKLSNEAKQIAIAKILASSQIQLNDANINLLKEEFSNKPQQRYFEKEKFFKDEEEQNRRIEKLIVEKNFSELQRELMQRYSDIKESISIAQQIVHLFTDFFTGGFFANKGGFIAKPQPATGSQYPTGY